MSKKISSLFLLFCFFFLISPVMLANKPPVKYWVKLKDKTGTPFSISNPSAFLTQKSILRRTTYNIKLDQTDLPVTPGYVSQIEAVNGVTVLYASKWLNGIVIAIDSSDVAPAALAFINNFPYVSSTGRVNRYRLNVPLPIENPEVSDLGLSGFRASGSAPGSFNYGGSNGQVKQLNVNCLHEQGYRGQGMTIAVLDVGFDNVDSGPIFDSLRNNGGILGTRDFVAGGTNAYKGGGHGTMVMSCMAGNKPKLVLGTAPLAKYWLLRTEDAGSETITEEYNWIRGAEFADSVGVDILTTSLGYTEFDGNQQNHTYATLNGRTAPMSIAATMAARKGMFVLNAAGNEGLSPWHFIGVPADADSICAVGAVDTLGVLGGFSSVGPTADGRIKPDLVACGTSAWVCDQSNVCFPGSGTSFATPILAGAVACFWQANKTLNNMKILDSLRKTATNANDPDNFRGWGIPNMCVSHEKTKVISGSAFLNGKDDHAGIKVKFFAISGSAVTDSTFTNSNGSYTIKLSAGIYRMVFSKIAYQDVFYNNKAKTTLNTSASLSSVTLFILPLPELDFDFTAFSDPINSVISISLNKTTYESISIEIFDMLGQLLISTDVKNTDNTININAYIVSDAIYLAKVKTSKGTKTKKFLKR